MKRCFDIHLWISFTPNAAVLFVDVAIQPEVRFIAKQNSLMKIGNNGNLVLGPFDGSTPCLMIVLMNCQTKLRINHLTAVKSVAILETAHQNQLFRQDDQSQRTGCLLLKNKKSIPFTKTANYISSIHVAQFTFLQIWRQSVVVPIFRRSRPLTRCRDTETNSAALTAMFAAPLDSDYASEEAAPRSQLLVAKMVANAKDISPMDGGIGM
ncbi:adhesion G protein-coupled receptor B2 [Trichonephila clavipes]|nr:adhesion G protein-coupled receptor B2 [Trichonephila clavipes]